MNKDDRHAATIRQLQRQVDDAQRIVHALVHHAGGTATLTMEDLAAAPSRIEVVRLPTGGLRLTTS